MKWPVSNNKTRPTRLSGSGFVVIPSLNIGLMHPNQMAKHNFYKIHGVTFTPSIWMKIIFTNLVKWWVLDLFYEKLYPMQCFRARRFVICNYRRDKTIVIFSSDPLCRQGNEWLNRSHSRAKQSYNNLCLHTLFRGLRGWDKHCASPIEQLNSPHIRKHGGKGGCVHHVWGGSANVDELHICLSAKMVINRLSPPPGVFYLLIAVIPQPFPSQMAGLCANNSLQSQRTERMETIQRTITIHLSTGLLPRWNGRFTLVPLCYPSNQSLSNCLYLPCVLGNCSCSGPRDSNFTPT